MSEGQYTHYPKQNGGGAGTVTSVGLSAPASILSVSGSPVTTTGTLALSLVVQNANKVWAGPTTGADANPTFRALVAADIPTITSSKISDFSTAARALFSGTAPVAYNSTTGAFSMHVADASNNGYLSSADWTTFNNKQSTITTGNITDAGTDGIVITGGTGAIIGSGVTLAQHVADSTHNGYLSSTDWSTFNNKGSGSVTSVALAVPASSLFGVSGSPVTSSGTLTLTTTGTSGGVPYFDSTSTLNSSALLTNHALVLGGGAAAAPKVLGSLGTTTTVLHGNASGDPTFGAVALGTDVSGTLLAAQFPALTGDVTTSAGSLATTLAATTNGTIATLSKSTGVAIHGTNTNDSAAAGYVGEYIESVVSSSASVGTSGQYADITNITLTAGDWEINALYYFDKNGATVTNAEEFIGTASGNNTTGQVVGSNYTAGAFGAGDGGGAAIPGYRVSISGSTTYYLKIKMNYTVATPKAAGRISARRFR